MSQTSHALKYEIVYISIPVHSETFFIYHFPLHMVSCYEYVTL